MEFLQFALVNKLDPANDKPELNMDGQNWQPIELALLKDVG
jgi:hypothetical protein